MNPLPPVISLPPAIFLMGSTAAGKTDLALELAQHFPCDIISVDSAMIYRGMDIGTAKPSSAQLAAAPHRLIDILDPAEAYSAAQFQRDALREMAQITQAGRIPLLVGGTMLYFRALQYGLSDLPAANVAVRERLENELQRNGLASLHARLAQIDPRAAARIHPHDTQRIQRALEVYDVSGVSLSDLIDTHSTRDGLAMEPRGFPYCAIKIAIVPDDRAELHRRIEARFRAMLTQGFVDEVERLRGRGDLHVGLPALRAVGYRQVWSHLQGEMSYDQMVERGIFATRQLAKRQLTWLRSAHSTVKFDISGNIFEKVLKHLAATLI